MRNEYKRADAERRNEIYQSLSTQGKLDHLDAILGDGVGAVKQRAKLHEVLAVEGAAIKEVPKKVKKKKRDPREKFKKGKRTK